MSRKCFRDAHCLSRIVLMLMGNACQDKYSYFSAKNECGRGADLKISRQNMIFVDARRPSTNEAFLTGIQGKCPKRCRFALTPIVLGVFFKFSFFFFSSLHDQSPRNASLLLQRASAVRKMLACF